MNRRAFTLIEMNFVVVLLLLLTTLVVPRMVAFANSRALADREAAVRRLPLEANNAARSQGEAVTVRVGSDALVMTRSRESGEQVEVKRVSLGDDMLVHAAERNGEACDAGSWSWTVYPDGSSDAAGLEFTTNGGTWSLVMSRRGDYQWLETALPDTSHDRWQAGEIVKREE